MATWIRTLWTDESGAGVLDYGVVVIVLLAAALVWFIEMGGGEGLASSLVYIGRRARQFVGLLP